MLRPLHRCRKTLLIPGALRICSAAFTITVMGCTVGPAFQHPETNSPTAWRAANGHQKAAWPTADWWRGFGSSQLDELIAQAEGANYDLAAAIARVREADAQARVAGAAPLPSVGATVGVVHDFHPPISDAGLYWVVPVPAGALQWSDGGRSAMIEMQDVAVIDQPKWPARKAQASPARMSFKMVFEATNKAVTYDDKSKLFRVTGFLAICRMEARVAVPSIGFTWRSDPIDTCPPAAFGVIGNEVNGKYYEEEVAR